jgi:hypothetical protein
VLKVELQLFLTSALDCGEWSALCPGKEFPVFIGWILGGFRADLDVKAKRQVPALAEPNPGRPTYNQMVGGGFCIMYFELWQ